MLAGSYGFVRPVWCSGVARNAARRAFSGRGVSLIHVCVLAIVSCVCVCVCVCVWMVDKYMYVYAYIHTYVYVYVHMCIYIYIYIKYGRRDAHAAVT